MPHVFRVSPRGLCGLRTDSVRTPRGLAGCQHGTDPRIIGGLSPCGVRAESEHLARTPRTELGIVQAEIHLLGLGRTRTEIQSVRTHLIA